MLQPQSNWFWFTENRQLMLSMGEQWQCTTAYGEKQIVDLPSVDISSGNCGTKDSEKWFSLSDTQWYLTIANSLVASGANFSEAQLTHILINATAALRFHKPISPKSWFFDEVENYGVHNRLARINNILNSGVVLILSDEEPLATCMLISAHLHLTEVKHLEQFELIKVAKNRLEPFLGGQLSQLTA
jgi:cell division protein ZapC